MVGDPVDPATGRPHKREFGPWILGAFRILAHLKGLRGTPFDVFGYGEERRLDRQLLAGRLSSDNPSLKH